MLLLRPTVRRVSESRGLMVKLESMTTFRRFLRQVDEDDGGR